MKAFAAIATLLAASALAHEKGGRAMGLVESVTPERIVVQTADGHPVAFSLTGETRFVIGNTPARLEDVRVGRRVVVHGKRVGEALQASEVKLGANPLPR
jgi:hypothetical protein